MEPSWELAGEKKTTKSADARPGRRSSKDSNFELITELESATPAAARDVSWVVGHRRSSLGGGLRLAGRSETRRSTREGGGQGREIFRRRRRRRGGEVEVGMRKREEEGNVLGWSRRGGKGRVLLRGAVEAIDAGELCNNTALDRIIFFTYVVV